MNLPEFELIQPHSLKEALTILSEQDGKAMVHAGGTALIVALRYRLSRPAVVVDLKGVPELDSVGRDEKGGLVIGSMATLERLERSPFLINEFPYLSQAIQLIAVPPIRRKATIGGNLCLDTRCIYYNQSEFWRSGQEACFKRGGKVCHAVEKGRRCQSVYQGDLAPLLLALGARLKIASANEERIIPLADFFTGRGEKPNVLKSDEILVEVEIPAPAGRVSGAYEKLRVREGMDFPMAGVGVALKRDGSGKIEQVKMVLGALGPSPIEVPKAGQLLEGHKPTDDLIEAVCREAMDRAHPVANLAINASYRRKMAGVLAKRALHRALAM